MNSKLLSIAGIILFVGLALGFLSKPLVDYNGQLFMAFGVGAMLAVLYTASTARGGAQLSGLRDALRAAARGKTPKLPEGAPPELADAFEQIAEIAERHADLAKNHGTAAQ